MRPTSPLAAIVCLAAAARAQNASAPPTTLVTAAPALPTTPVTNATQNPTLAPTLVPTVRPTLTPSTRPTGTPSAAPTLRPTESETPTAVPTVESTPGRKKGSSKGKDKNAGATGIGIIFDVIIACLAFGACLCASFFCYRNEVKKEEKRAKRKARAPDVEAPPVSRGGPTPTSEVALPEDRSLDDLLDIVVSSTAPGAGVAAARGWRPTMEDAHVVDPVVVRGATVLAVFDGHGGDRAAKFAAREFAPRIGEMLADPQKRRRWTFEPEDDKRGEQEAQEALIAALLEIDDTLANFGAAAAPSPLENIN